MRVPWQRLVSWPVLSVLLGLTLLTAAALKGHEIATTELLEKDLLSSRWFLVLVVEWEILFALWLLGGYYRFYPRTTCLVALLYFSALYVVAVDSVLKGQTTCPCFGKSLVPPWVTAAFDLAVLLLLAALPAPAAAESPRRYHWFAPAAVYSVFGLLSLITMVDYSTTDAVSSIRRDGRLFDGKMAIHLVRPPTEDFLELLRKAVGLHFAVDAQLIEHQPDYGVWDLKATEPWAVMELLVVRQMVPARWDRTHEGYELVPAAPFGKSRTFWSSGTALLALYILGLRWRNIVH